MTPPQSPGGVGARLREARERRGLSLQQIAGTTKISSSVLAALERNDIARLPGGILGRAFVRAYAKEVGLDPEETVREFMRQFPTEAVTAGHPAIRTEDRQAADSAERAAVTIGRLMLVSIPLAALVLFKTGLNPSGSAAPLDAPSETPAPALLDSRPVTTPISTIPVPLPVVAAESGRGPLVLTLEARGTSWVSVVVDGRVVLQRELQAGDRAEFEVEQAFSVRARDAGVLALAVDGREVQSFDSAAEDFSFRASRDGDTLFPASP